MRYQVFNDNLNNTLTDNNTQILSFRIPDRRKNIMAQKLIMAGVANVDIFSGDNLIGTATTLTDSSLTIGLSTEDIRGGQGAALLGRYFHTSTFELTLTDALFDLNYIAWSVGAELEDGSDILFNEERKGSVVADGEITLSHAARPLGGCDGEIYGWYRLASEPNGDWNRGTVEGNVLSGADIAAGNVYCVKYFYNENAAKKIRVKADYIPDTLHLVLKENLYAGGDMSGSASTKVGYLVIDIPRFQLDGSQDLSMNMTGASTTSLKGSALRSEGCEAGCEEGGYYATMTQVLTGANWYDGITGLAVEGGAAAAGKPWNLYAIFSNRVPRLITADMLEGLYLRAGDITITTFDAAPAAGFYDLVLANVATEPVQELATGRLVTEGNADS